MVLADTLSRACLPTSERQKSETEEEVETIHMTNHLPISEPQLKEIQRETTRDATLQSLKETILKGWPEKKEKIPQCIHPYFSVRDELATQDDVIFKGQRAIVPESLRQKIREKLHVAHTGIQSCLRRAREAVYWPGINKDLTDFISKCEICNTFQNNQNKEPLIPKTEDGRIFRRNRKFLRHTNEPFNVDEEDSIAFPTKEQEATTENPEDRQPEDGQPLDQQEPFQVRPDDVDAETVAARPAEIRFDHRQLNFYRPVTTRSGRRVIRPDYLAGHNN